MKRAINDAQHILTSNERKRERAEWKQLSNSENVSPNGENVRNVIEEEK